MLLAYSGSDCLTAVKTFVNANASVENLSKLGGAACANVLELRDSDVLNAWKTWARSGAWVGWVNTLDCAEGQVSK